MQFDDVLIQLGQFGKYQRIQYFLLCLPGILCAFHQLASVFLSYTPLHRCKLPADVYNQSDTYEIQSPYHESVIRSYIPKNPKYEGNITMDMFMSCDTMNSTACPHGYVYSKAEMTSSIVSQWDLVCDTQAQIKGTISSSVYMAGVLVGAFAFGILSDVIGRKKTLLICILLQGSSGLGVAFAPEYWSFIFLRFLAGAASMGLFMTAFVLGMELIGPKYRLVAGIVIQYFFAIGYVLLTGIAYAAKEWSYIQIAISAPSFIFLIYFWIVPESARWLIANRRVEEAEEVVHKAAKVNNVVLPDQVFSSLDEGPATVQSIRALCGAKTLLIRTIVIFFNWLVVAMGYYGLSLNSGTLGGSIYVNFMLGGLVEFPAYTLCFACNKLGRKGPHIFGMLIGGFACLGMVFLDMYGKHIPKGQLDTYFVILNMTGKFGMTIGFCLIYLWSAELYPTSLRNSMMGFSSTMARVGSIAAPFIADLGKYVPPVYSKVLPASIFGSLVVIGGLLSAILPETTNHSLPETIEEANDFPNHNRDKYGQTVSTADLLASRDSETKFGGSDYYGEEKNEKR